jgi:hypothetical protein
LRAVRLSGGSIEGFAGPVLESGSERGAGQVAGRHESIEVGMVASEVPVGREQGRNRTAGGGRRHGRVHPVAGLEQCLVHQLRDDGITAGKMLVERGRLDAEFVAESTHGECLRALGLDELARCPDDLGYAVAARVRFRAGRDGR